MTKVVKFCILIILTLLFRSGALAATNVGGNITTDTTWTLAGSPYIVTSSINAYSTSAPVLTIEPGVTVKFNQNTGITVGYNNGYTAFPGALNAVGTAESPIVFTSNQATPTPGYWSGITFNNETVDASTVLDYVTVEYGGGNGSGNLYLTSASPTIKNCTIRKSSTSGISAASSSAIIQDSTILDNSSYGIYSSSSPLTITGNTISNNGSYGLYDTGSAALISGNTFSGNASYPVRMSINRTGNTNTYGTNGTNAIEVVGGTISQSLTVKNQSLPYVITSTINAYSTSAPVLTIEPGVTVSGDLHLQDLLL